MIQLGNSLIRETKLVWLILVYRFEIIYIYIYIDK